MKAVLALICLVVAGSGEQAGMAREGVNASALAAQQVDPAIAAYKRADYPTALRLFRPMAAKGDAAAQFHLGLMYAKGQGVTQDYAQAVNWYRKAAEQGGAEAFLE